MPMSMTNPTTTRSDGPGTMTSRSGAMSDGSGATHRPATERKHRSMRETKPSFMTTEFWAMAAGIVALVVLYNYTDNPDLTLWRTCLLSTIIASAYIVSRGWAKSGSHDDHWETDNV
jgi:hypothetical protein